MKNLLSSIIIITLIITLFPSCNSFKKPENSNTQHYSSEQTSLITETSVQHISNENTFNSNPSNQTYSIQENQNASKESILIFNQLNEPPLSEYTKEIPVPIFLEEDQQNTYRHAREAARFLFMESADIDSYPKKNSKDVPKTNPTIEKDGIGYDVALGRYENWSDFEEMMFSLFTEDYFKELVCRSNLPLFISIDGKMHFINFSRGGNILAANEPDSFELISKTDTEIKFFVIGHYLNDIQTKSDEEWINRKSNGFDYTKKYPITMIKTKSGWRFSEFHITR